MSESYWFILHKYTWWCLKCFCNKGICWLITGKQAPTVLNYIYRVWHLLTMKLVCGKLSYANSEKQLTYTRLCYGCITLWWCHSHLLQKQKCFIGIHCIFLIHVIYMLDSLLGLTDSVIVSFVDCLLVNCVAELRHHVNLWWMELVAVKIIMVAHRTSSGKEYWAYQKSMETF